MTLLHISVIENSIYLCPIIFHLLLSLIFSHALFISILSTFKFSKASKLFVILSWESSLTFPSIGIFILNCSTTNFSADCLCTDTATLTSATTRQWSISHSAPLKYLTTISYLSTCDQCDYVSSRQNRYSGVYDYFNAAVFCSYQTDFLMCQSSLLWHH